MYKQNRSKSVDSQSDYNKMENDLLDMQSLKSDMDNLKSEVIRFSKETSDTLQSNKFETDTTIQRLEQKIDKLIDKDESKDYSSDEESNYNQDRRGKSTVLSAIKNIRSIVLSEPKPANLNLWLDIAKRILNTFTQI